MPPQLTKLPLSLIRDTRTRTNPSSSGSGTYNNNNNNNNYDGGGILPGGGYGNSNKKGNSRQHHQYKHHRDPAIYLGAEYGGNGRSGRGSKRGGGGVGRFWSPYARPPRRSKRLVILWILAFLMAGMFTWWLSSARRAGVSGAGGSGGVDVDSVVGVQRDELSKSYGEVLKQRPGKVPVEE